MLRVTGMQLYFCDKKPAEGNDHCTSGGHPGRLRQIIVECAVQYTATEVSLLQPSPNHPEPALYGIRCQLLWGATSPQQMVADLVHYSLYEFPEVHKLWIPPTLGPAVRYRWALSFCTSDVIYEQMPPFDHWTKKEGLRAEVDIALWSYMYGGIYAWTVADIMATAPNPSEPEILYGGRFFSSRMMLPYAAGLLTFQSTSGCFYPDPNNDHQLAFQSQYPKMHAVISGPLEPH